MTRFLNLVQFVVWLGLMLISETVLIAASSGKLYSAFQVVWAMALFPPAWYFATLYGFEAYMDLNDKESK